MESTTFLSIDDENLSLAQAMRLLKSAGGFQRTVADILRQHLLEQELVAREDITVEPFRVDQALMDFRLQSNLSDPNKFREWMSANGVNYRAFQDSIAFGIKVSKLKREVAETRLEDYFNERREDLERVVLSRLIVGDRELADNLKTQLLADPSQFAVFAKEHSLTEDGKIGGMMGAIRKNTLPQSLKEKLIGISTGAIAGVVELEGRFCLFRLEEILPATLEGRLKQELQDEIFERWLQEKLDKVRVKMAEFA